MPERPLMIAAYAAGASLAAATLVYVFGPTFFLDDSLANSTQSARKNGIVGLSNPANDCFINSVLQALAGLPDLRLYLIRETHRRRLNGGDAYADLTAALQEQRKKKGAGGTVEPEWKLSGLQRGVVTAALKDMLDALNERPIYRKTISAKTFILAVENAFHTRISRYQQDAHEFLQIVTERLADEHNAERKVRRRARRTHGVANVLPPDDQSEVRTPQDVGENDKALEARHISRNDTLAEFTHEPQQSRSPSDDIKSEQGDKSERQNAMGEDDDCEAEKTNFPLQGKLESQIECSACHFRPKPSESSFVTLTLNVPHDVTSTSLNACFDGMLKVEHIDDFRCDRCRLEHAIQMNAKQMGRSDVPAAERQVQESDQIKLSKAFRDDPENPPKDVRLPDVSSAPKRRISRHMRISFFPRVLAIHLSRSVWDGHATSSKNLAKVSFPETLPLGGLLDRKTYRLLSVVTHKGGHNSGHYETFRRQWLPPPYFTPASMGREGISLTNGSPAASPRLDATGVEAAVDKREGQPPGIRTDVANVSAPSPVSSTSSVASADSFQQSSIDRRRRPTETDVPVEDTAKHTSTTPSRAERASLDSAAASTLPGQQSKRNPILSKAANMTKKRRGQDRWWRISDDKIKESKTSEVLAMQREVYLLFYELAEV